MSSCTPSRRGCSPIGLLSIAIEEGALEVVVTKAELKNPSYPGSTYDALRFTGGSGGPTASIILPAPASLDDAYSIEVENRTDTAFTVYSGIDTSDGFTLLPFQTNEVSLEEEIQDAAATMSTYRTRVRVTPAGAYRVPGFSGP